MSNASTPSADQLARALKIAEQIEQLEGQLASLLGGGSKSSSQAASSPAAKTGGAPKKRGGRRTMSAEARARIAAAQRARWSKVKGQQGSESGGAKQASAAKQTSSAKSGKKQKGKRVISPEARAKMAEAARRRWANARK